MLIAAGIGASVFAVVVLIGIILGMSVCKIRKILRQRARKARRLPPIEMSGRRVNKTPRIIKSGSGRDLFKISPQSSFSEQGDMAGVSSVINTSSCSNPFVKLTNDDETPSISLRSEKSVV